MMFYVSRRTAPKSLEIYQFFSCHRRVFLLRLCFRRRANFIMFSEKEKIFRPRAAQPTTEKNILRRLNVSLTEGEDSNKLRSIVCYFFRVLGIHPKSEPARMYFPPLRRHTSERNEIKEKWRKTHGREILLALVLLLRR